MKGRMGAEVHRPAAVRSFTKDELEEVFAVNPIREVDFEVRFTPRLRVQAEMWRFQDKVMSEYPDASIESAILPNAATLNVTVFQSQAKARLIKVSPQNMALAFSAYANFEEFKDEVLKRTAEFCEIFDITSFTRVGLRYVNEIPLPNQDPESMVKYVKPMVSLDRIPLETVQQFALQISATAEDHMVLMRTAMIPGPIRTYILDIDAYTEIIKPASSVGTLLDQFHNTSQRVFLDHVTDDYKKVMRGK